MSDAPMLQPFDGAPSGFRVMLSAPRSRVQIRPGALSKCQAQLQKFYVITSLYNKTLQSGHKEWPPFCKINIMFSLYAYKNSGRINTKILIRVLDILSITG